MRVVLSDEGQKTLELIFTFFKTLFLSFPKSGRFVPSDRKTENFCRYKKIDTYLYVNAYIDLR
ncbi:hypothetical protein EBB54_00500 [Schaedlerella arabinosiphila]|uniref:Uncharacterized protein n=1 Tax=Schaedlerella arabinosiphila TaxID=2044587 RepID=A0A3R8M4E0_9FIRM|nr:hypothetical protein EBB54_00500 [Schaedlerella arabinosiphila]